MKKPVNTAILIPLLLLTLLFSCDKSTCNSDSDIYVIAQINDFPQICRINVLSKEPVPLTDFNNLIVSTVQRNWEYLHRPLLLSPDGRLLLFEGNTTIGSIPDDFDWYENGKLTEPTEEMYEEWGYKSIDELYVFDLNSGEILQITNHSTEVLYADWSPDSNEIAYVIKGENGFDIYTIKVDGSSPRHIVSEEERRTMGLSWSPDGKQIVFSKVGDLFVVNPEKPNTEDIISDSGNNNVYSVCPRWSPTEMLLASISSPIDETGARSQMGIFISNKSGSNTRRITPSEHFVTRYDWSPDGSKLVYSKTRFLSSSIYVVNKDGSEPMRLYWTWGYSNIVKAPFWSIDGNFVVFVRHRESDISLLSVRADGSGKAEVLRPLY